MLRGALAALLLLAALAALATPNGGAVVAGLLGSADLPPGRLVEALAPHLSPRPGDPRTTRYASPRDAFERHAMTAPHDGRVWHAWAPPGDAPLRAAVVLLHGSLRDGPAMIDQWRDVAAREGLLLVAPDSADPEGWSPRADGPGFLETVLAEAATLHPFDPERVYLYGHSAGAIHALRLAGHGPWRAVAAHGGAPVGTLTTRPGVPVPVRLQIGDQDELFPLTQVRGAARALAAAGHDVELAVIPRHGHWLYDQGPRLAADAWAFFAAR